MRQILYPPANGASQANYFLPKSHKLANFEEKTGIVTDRQTDKFFDTIYGGMWIFYFGLISYLPTCFARRGIKNL